MCENGLSRVHCIMGMHACIYSNAEGGVSSDGLILKQKADGRLYLVDVLEDPNDNQGSIDICMHTCVVANCPETGGPVPKILDMSRSCPEFPLC